MGNNDNDGNGAAPEVLNWVQTYAIPFATCKAKYAANHNELKDYTSDMVICAGDGGEDACQGDSGGPLVAANEACEPVQYGVDNWAIDCGNANFPGVYASV